MKAKITKFVRRTIPKIFFIFSITLTSVLTLGESYAGVNPNAMGTILRDWIDPSIVAMVPLVIAAAAYAIFRKQATMLESLTGIVVFAAIAINAEVIGTSIIDVSRAIIT